MTQLDHATTVRVAHADLLRVTAAIFAARGVPQQKAALAAEALCYGDLAGMSSHGLVNLTRLYLPLFDEGRVDPVAEPETLTDLGAAVLVDAHRALGLWAAAQAVDLAAARAAAYGVGMVSVRNATHFGCAGFHAARAAHRDMIGVVAANCGRQRIAPPPGGRAALLGTNPLSVAAPALPGHPFVLDMSTTAAPTGRIRAAARAGDPVPAEWLADDDGRPVTDPTAFDRGTAHLRWLGGDAGQHKGFGLGLAVEVLAALLPGAGLGPAPEALTGDGSGRDDDIGFLALVIAPGALRRTEDFLVGAESLFGTLLACPPRPGHTVRYPGWHEARRCRDQRANGVALPNTVHRELRDAAEALGIAPVLRQGTC
ncbi:Ldh family oxidoreductase [Actinophytocola sp.]|uniref:Ldh family oxidoreductase n=1 Tax=Actinophytocola sp. TaxID=1872138 RepID=UPI003899C208